MGNIVEFPIKPIREMREDFRVDYVNAVAALQMENPTVTNLAKKIAWDRPETSRFVNDHYLRLDTATPGELYNDGVATRVWREAVTTDNYSIIDATNRYQDIVTNATAQQYGVSEAAEMLDVSERTVRNRMHRYQEDPRNAYLFHDDTWAKPTDITDRLDDKDQDSIDRLAA